MTLYVVEFWANNPELKKKQVFRHYWEKPESAKHDKEEVMRGRYVHGAKILVYNCTLEKNHVKPSPAKNRAFAYITIHVKF